MDEETKNPRKTGRPSIDPDMVRTPRTVRLSAKEEADITARSTAAGMTVSAFMRAAAQGTPIQPVRSVSSAELVGQLRRIGNNLNQTLYEARVRNFPPAVAEAAEETLRELSSCLRRVLHGPEY